MYIPSKFSATQAQLKTFIDDFGFASLITQANGHWFTTMVPMLIDEELVLTGHMARANPHWQELAQWESLVLFQGPHSYISPSWYANSEEVPTWNYAMARATVTATLIEDVNSLDQLVRQTIDKYETPLGNPWDQVIDQDYWQKQLQHIVGFRLTISELSGKFKLGQNRPSKDRLSLSQALEQNPGGRELWEFMRKALGSRP